MKNIKKEIKNILKNNYIEDAPDLILSLIQKHDKELVEEAEKRGYKKGYKDALDSCGKID